MEPDVGPAAPTAASEPPPSSEEDEATGFDPEFLGVAAIMPRMGDAQAAASVELTYEHFTVMLDTVRRFAGVTAVNIDGARLVKVPREDRWEFDERISTDLQAGPEVYADNDLDRGHLVRRNDPVWGDPAVAARANTDTFRFTNAAPQASGFNQSRELWLGLEDHVLEHARVHALKLSVFTGPVLTDDDPPYRGIRIPLKFWKIAAWNTGEALATTRLRRRPVAARRRRPAPRALGAPPPLGPFRTFQVRIGTSRSWPASRCPSSSRPSTCRARSRGGGRSSRPRISSSERAGILSVPESGRPRGPARFPRGRPQGVTMLNPGSPGSSTPSTDCSALASPSSSRPPPIAAVTSCIASGPSADFGTVIVSVTSPRPSRT